MGYLAETQADEDTLAAEQLAVYHPTSITLVNERLQIAWNDDLVLQYDPVDLRRRCPCATCNEQRLRLELAREAPLPDTPDVTIVQMSPVGNYGYKITFSDGHDTGIYDLELLRQLGKPCEE